MYSWPVFDNVDLDRNGLASISTTHSEVAIVAAAVALCKPESGETREAPLRALLPPAAYAKLIELITAAGIGLDELVFLVPKVTPAPDLVIGWRDGEVTRVALCLEAKINADRNAPLLPFGCCRIELGAWEVVRDVAGVEVTQLRVEQCRLYRAAFEYWAGRNRDQAYLALPDGGVDAVVWLLLTASEEAEEDRPEGYMLAGWGPLLTWALNLATRPTAQGLNQDDRDAAGRLLRQWAAPHARKRFRVRVGQKPARAYGTCRRAAVSCWVNSVPVLEHVDRESVCTVGPTGGWLLLGPDGNELPVDHPELADWLDDLAEAQELWAHTICARHDVAADACGCIDADGWSWVTGRRAQVGA